MVRPKSGFTVMELLIVLIVVGVLGTMSIIHMISAREEALEKEAESNLKIIIAAERVYRLETGSYITLNGVAAINQNLNLVLASSNWEYKTVANNAASPPTVDARARRLGVPIATATRFCLNQSAINATKNGTCVY